VIWAVLDTNILVSGMAFSGPPSHIVELLRTGQFVSVTSRALLDELARTLQTEKLARHFREGPVIVMMIESISIVVEPATRLEVIEEDPADNRLLEAAQAGHADFLVTGDKHVLRLGSFDGTEIVTARQFLERLFPGGAPHE
jgi:putative PIN family toxin of toxin-antitoxin system